MAEILLPIIVVEGHDVDLHFTVEDAEKALEPWWVRQHEGTIYDAAGHRLSVEIVAQKGSPFPFGTGAHEKIRIVTGTPLVDAREELRRALIQHLLASGEVHGSDSISTMPLSELINLVVDSRKR